MKNMNEKEAIDLLHTYMGNLSQQHKNPKIRKAIDRLIDIVEEKNIFYDAYKKEKQRNEELVEDLTTVYMNGIYDERDKWNIKIKRKIEEINNEDLEIYNTDSEDVKISKYEQRAILDFCKELLGDEK